MANRVTNEDILRMNEIYYKTHVFAEVARQTGFSASTVKKYVVPGWQPVTAENIIHFDLAELPDFTRAAELFKGIDNYGNLCMLTQREQEEVKNLWTELVI